MLVGRGRRCVKIKTLLASTVFHSCLLRWGVHVCALYEGVEIKNVLN